MDLTVCIDGTGLYRIASVEWVGISGGPTDFRRTIVVDGVEQDSYTRVDCTMNTNSCRIQTNLPLLEFVDATTMPTIFLSGVVGVVPENDGAGQLATGIFLFKTELQSLTRPVAPAVQQRSDVSAQALLHSFAVVLGYSFMLA